VPFPLSVSGPIDPVVVESWTSAPPEVSGVPAASRSSTVIVEVLVPFAGIDVGEAVIWEVAPDGGPGPTPVNVTVASSVIALPLTVPLIVAVTLVGDEEEVRVAVYVPLPLSISELSDPAVVESWTSAPPVVSGVPAASRSSTVIVDVLVPFAGIDVGEAVICDVAPEGGPGPTAVKVTLAVSVIEFPFTVPLTVSVPAVDDDVSVAW
jgi:hypothetical protein